MTVAIRVSNVGPLLSAEAETNWHDLVLFTGNNNTGKLFSASLLHQVADSATRHHVADVVRPLEFLERYGTSLRSDIVHKLTGGTAPSQVEQVQGIDESTFMDVMESLYKRAATDINTLLASEGRP